MTKLTPLLPWQVWSGGKFVSAASIRDTAIRMARDYNWTNSTEAHLFSVDAKGLPHWEATYEKGKVNAAAANA